MDDQYMVKQQELDERLDEEVFSTLDELEEEFFPDHSAYHTVFIEAMHCLFEMGWTKEELLQEVEDHFLLHQPIDDMTH